ncbi:MAG: hypothetical protein ACE5EY_15355, partial [Anaerolineae bacterium]
MVAINTCLLFLNLHDGTIQLSTNNNMGGNEMKIAFPTGWLTKYNGKTRINKEHIDKTPNALTCFINTFCKVLFDIRFSLNELIDLVAGR